MTALVLIAASSTDGIRCVGLDAVTIHGFKIVQRKKAVFLNDCTNSLVYDMTIESCSEEVRVNDGATNTVELNIISDTKTQAAVRIQNSDGSIVRDNTLDHNRDDGIYVVGAANVEVGYNSLDDNDYGVRTSHADNINIHNNDADDNEFTGIMVSVSDPLTITENNADSNDAYGIYVKNSPPIDDVNDLIAAMNTASNNVRGNFRVD